MGYHGYIKVIKHFMNKLENPRILEIGIDRGQTCLPILIDQIKNRKKFLYEGIDIKIQNHLPVIFGNIDFEDGQVVAVHNENSLTVLADMKKQKSTYDIILIDGDHNYHTVSKELAYLNDLSHERTLVICDDYDGRWSKQDLYYSEKKGYKDNMHATKKLDTQLKGVQAAVDEFLDNNPDWKAFQPINGEPVVLAKDHEYFGFKI